MFSLSSLGVPKFGFGRSSVKGKIDIPSVEIHDVETDTDKRGRSLKHLLKLNHTNFSILYNDLKFHNHTPHILGSAYLLGGTADHLNDIYEDVSKNEGHEPWKDSPSEIALHDYRDYLGLKDYQRAWLDFFEDQLVLLDYDWKNVVNKFLFEEGSKKRPNPLPIFNSIVSGLGHPLIHLGYAYELNNREVAMEAMALTAACYDPRMAEVLNNNLVGLNTANILTYSTSNPFEVLARLSGDKRLDGAFTSPGHDNVSRLLSDNVLLSILLEHWSAWKITDPREQFEQSQQVATALLFSTAQSAGGYGYDFFLVHCLTTSHAVRIIIPMMEPKYHLSLVREWWFLILAVYIAQLRPVVKVDHINNFNLEGRSWQTCRDLILVGKHKFNAHYVKAVRAMKEAATTWGDKDDYYLKAAVKFATEFSGWAGFTAEHDSGGHGGPEKDLR